MFDRMLENFSKILFNLKLYKLTNLLNKFIGFLYGHRKDLYYKYKFYLRKNKIYDENFLKNIYPPNVFLIKNINFGENIFSKIQDYKDKNPTNEYDYRGHYNIYQSLHNLNDQENFDKINKLITNIIQKKIIPHYCLNEVEIKLEKLWFTITKKEGKMKKHHHLDGELSGVLYLKCEESENSGHINLYNYSNKMNYYESNGINDDFVKSIYKKDILKHKPKVGDLIIFDSYIDHDVDHSEEIRSERISMPLDLSINFNIKK